MLAIGGVLGFIFSPVSDAAKSVADGILGVIAGGIAAAVAYFVKGIATFWVSIPTPELASAPGSSTPAPTVAFIQSHLWWYMAAAAIAGVLVGGARMAWEQRADAGRDVVRSLLVFIATVGAGLAVISLLTAAADQFSTWIIATSTNGTSFGANMTAMLGLSALLASGGVTSALLVIFFGGLIILVSLVQMVLMIVRGGMLVLLAGVLPTTAAFTSTQVGRQWFRRSVGWLAAFILYKPAAAIIYATSFQLAGADAFGSGGPVNIVTGLMLMVLAVLALPALMKFVTPLVGATAAGSGASVLAGAGGLAAAGAMARGLPTGARATAGPAGAGGAGPSGPGGSVGTPGVTDRGPGGPDARPPSGSGSDTGSGNSSVESRDAVRRPGGEAGGSRGVGGATLGLAAPAPGSATRTGAAAGPGPQSGRPAAAEDAGTGGGGQVTGPGPAAGSAASIPAGGSIAARAAHVAGAVAGGAERAGDTAVDPSGATDAPTDRSK